MMTEKQCYWFLVFVLSFMICFFFAGKTVVGEEVTIEGNKITITGDKPFDAQYWETRQIKAKGIVDAEIGRRHELQVEVAKFKNALMLERAGAPNISVRAYASNKTAIQQNAGKGTVVNKIKGNVNE